MTTENETDGAVQRSGPVLLSTAATKGLVTALTLVAAVVGGFLGREVVIDVAAVYDLADHVNALYGAILALIGATTWFVRSGKNLWKNRDKIREHGVKVRKGSDGLLFDFAPKEEDGIMLRKVCGLVAIVAIVLLIGASCATSLRQSLVEQGSAPAQTISDVLGEAQAKTLAGALEYFEKKRELQITNIAKWKEEAGQNIDTPANQFALDSFNLAVSDTDNKIRLITRLQEEAAAVRRSETASP